MPQGADGSQYQVRVLKVYVIPTIVTYSMDVSAATHADWQLATSPPGINALAEIEIDRN